MKWRSLEESAPQLAKRSLREVCSERKALIAQYVPAEVQAIHGQVIQELEASGIRDRSLQAGRQAPAFELPDPSGKIVSSAELLELGPLVVCFFRGRWCPFCVAQLEAMNVRLERLQELRASLVGISPQTPEQSFFMADQHHLRFPLLSDGGNEVARRFGLVYGVPDYQQEIYRRVFVNLPFVNGSSDWELPIPATYVLACRREERSRASSIILFAASDPDYTKRPEPDEIVDVVADFSQAANDVGPGRLHLSRPNGES
ncbi:MAG: AhpC/TSA family protein [Acidobacteria bacterium]|nr:AhpC/TSA family protein [Acidobacteriota bacterium]